MENDTSIEDVRQAIEKVMHPAIDRSLMDLGMLRDITLKGASASLTLVIPFPGIPILSFLEKSLKESASMLGVNLEIKIENMNQDEIQSFLAMEKEAWKGL